MISAVCPNEIRTMNRRAKYEKFRRTKRYRDRVAFLNQGKSCVICGATTGLTRHHTRESDYADEETYYRALDWAVPMCNLKCHRRWHKGKTKTCPVCGRELIAPEAEYCYTCTPPEVREAREVRVVLRRKRQRILRKANYNRARDRLAHKGERLK